MKTHRSRFTALAALAVASFGLGAASTPAEAGLFSIKPEKEKRMGDEAARSIEAQSRVVSGPVADWVERVGVRLVKASNPEFQYSFRVLDSPEINAFALPGGHIYVCTGLSKIARNDDELAAVLAHEITHAEQHHFARQYKRASKRGALLSVLSIAVGLPGIAQNVLGLADAGLTQKHSRDHENESDRMGLERMAKAGFDPRGMVSLLERLDRQDGDPSRVDRWFASHPDGKARVEKARQMLATLQASKPAATAVATTAAPATASEVAVTR